MRIWVQGVIIIGVWSFGVFIDGALAQNTASAKTKAAQVQPQKSNLQKATGRVLDKDGKPVAGAQLYIRPLQENKLVLATADKDGKFSTEIPAGDSYNKFCSKPSN